MSEQIVANPGAGTGEEVSSQPVVQDQGGQEQVVGQQVQDNSNVDVNALRAENARLADENRRQREYAEFIRRSRTEQPQQPQLAQRQSSLDPDAIPFVSDVDRLIEERISGVRSELENERVTNELRVMADNMRSSDPTFDDRMNLAIELLELKPAYKSIFFNECKTAQEKIDFLEWASSKHPLYVPPAGQPARVTPASTAIEKLKQNNNIPVTLSSIASSSMIPKSIRQMSDQEYADLVARTKAQA